MKFDKKTKKQEDYLGRTNSICDNRFTFLPDKLLIVIIDELIIWSKWILTLIKDNGD